VTESAGLRQPDLRAASSNQQREMIGAAGGAVGLSWGMGSQQPVLSPGSCYDKSIHRSEVCHEIETTTCCRNRSIDVLPHE
jgi:hypothetical protein